MARRTLKAGAEPGFLERLETLGARLEREVPDYRAAADARRRTDALYARVRGALRDLRLAKGWDQARLGAAAGLGQSAISKIESGRADLSFRTICRLADALGYGLNVSLAPLEEASAAPLAAARRARRPDPALVRDVTARLGLAPSAAAAQDLEHSLGRARAALAVASEAIDTASAATGGPLRRAEAPVAAEGDFEIEIEVDGDVWRALPATRVRGVKRRRRERTAGETDEPVPVFNARFAAESQD